ncbi:hypothetical protein NKG94_45990 [Micromonospora sp. M12]
MFGTNLLDRRSKPERIADQAWEHLLSVVNSAGDSVRDTARAARHNSSDLADGRVTWWAPPPTRHDAAPRWPSTRSLAASPRCPGRS